MGRTWSLPNPDDPDVTQLNEINSLVGVPEIVKYENHNYDPAFCHVSAKHIALQRGVRRVHGWSYWRVTDVDESSGQSASLMMAEHHSVWENEKGKLIDVTPPRHGGAATLFLRDDSATIASAAGDIWIRCNLMDLKAGLFMRDGEMVTYPSYMLSDQSSDLARRYAERIGFDMAKYPTDEEHG
jgi:hypothetical protein